MMQDIRENQIKEPVQKLMGNALWIWKEPVVGHKYIMGVDVSRGDSEDFSSFQIIDFDEMEQVAEFMAHCLPRDLIKFIDRIGRWYNNAIAVVERNNGGDTLIDELRLRIMYPRLWRKKDIFTSYDYGKWYHINQIIEQILLTYESNKDKTKFIYDSTYAKYNEVKNRVDSLESDLNHEKYTLFTIEKVLNINYNLHLQNEESIKKYMTNLDNYQKKLRTIEIDITIKEMQKSIAMLEKERDEL
jgi:hypothetical protein